MNEDFGKAWTQCCNYLKSDGSFTGKEVRQWIESLDVELCHKVLQVLIQVKWTDIKVEGLPKAIDSNEPPSHEVAAAEGGTS
jgi:hypothetical protein